MQLGKVKSAHITYFAWAIAIMIGMNAEVLKAQNYCEQQLDKAKESYKIGRLYEVPEILGPCLNNLPRAQKIAAYRLLTLSYLLTDERQAAEQSFLNLLKVDPEYDSEAENDPVELVYLSKKFRTTPIFSFTVARVGTNVSWTTVINNFGVDNTSNSKETYTAKIGFDVGMGASLHLNERFSLQTDLILAQKRYKYENQYFNEDNLEFVENIVFLDLPIYLKYTQPFKKIAPYIYAGFALSMIITSNASVEFTNRLTDGEGEESEQSFSGADINLDALRSNTSRAIVMGAGVSRRIGYNFIAIEARWMPGLSNLADQSRRFEAKAEDLIYRFAYVSDDFRLNSLGFFVSFTKPLYKPRAIKTKPKTGNFLKGIFAK